MPSVNGTTERRSGRIKERQAKHTRRDRPPSRKRNETTKKGSGNRNENPNPTTEARRVPSAQEDSSNNATVEEKIESLSQTVIVMQKSIERMEKIVQNSAATTTPTPKTTSPSQGPENFTPEMTDQDVIPATQSAEFPEIETRCPSTADKNPPSTDIAGLRKVTSNLVKSSMANSTTKFYKKAWSDLQKFCASKLSISDGKMPVSIPTLSLFLADLYSRGLAPNTLYSYNAAVGFFHKLNGYEDPSSSYFIKKLLLGARKSRVNIDSRMPITQAILLRLVTALDNICSLPYYRILYKSMFLLAFYGLLRVGEMTFSESNLANHCLELKDINFQGSNVNIVFRSHKHSIPGQVSTVGIRGIKDKNMCPVYSLKTYLSLRGQNSGFLFVHPSMIPISRSQFTNVLNNSLNFLELSSNVYKGHSFRIGGCTWLAENGLSEIQLRKMGRWRSNAFLKYIRPVS